jgi:ATP-dependent helicase HrpA
VIVTSATLDAERFKRTSTMRPVIEVSGRLYPIEMRWRPPARRRRPADAIVDAVDECHRNGPGDVLVFLPGEREIREAAEALRKHHPPGTELLPLYARQSAQEQQRVFAPAKGRRVVLATNVAETSLTVPGIRYVSTRAWRASSATPTATRWRCCRSRTSPAPPPTSAPGAAAAS